MTFHELHSGPEPLLLPNAWDVASAIAFVHAGFAAIGTTSFGVNTSAGDADARGGSRDGTAALVRRLSALPAFISADIEDGYSDDPGEVAEIVAELAADGPAGVNLEDSTRAALVPAAAHAAKVAAVKRAAPDVFVNARVETFWLGIDATVEATVACASAYVEAGADGVFVPGATDPSVLERLAARIPVPLNVLVVPGLTLARLGDLGVRRVSTGSLPYRAAIDAAAGVATAVRDGGSAPAATSYAEWRTRLEQYSARDETVP